LHKFFLFVKTAQKTKKLFSPLALLKGKLCAKMINKNQKEGEKI